MKLRKGIIVLLVSLLLVPIIRAQELKKLIPQPKKVIDRDSEVLFTNFRVIDNGGFINESDLLVNYLSVCGIPQSSDGDIGQLKIKFEKVEMESPVSWEGVYMLEVGDTVIITSPDASGAFYACQTLKQLISDGDGTFQLPSVIIKDWPSFSVRGIMHDNGRNYQTLDQLKEQLEYLAFYKMNTFHWHLTDYHGWRLESKIYPELQSDKATSRKAGMYYSQEEFRDMIDFCAKRHITIIPEFDVPGHTLAFREAFDGLYMNDPRAAEILSDLIDELCTLATPEQMPYIHLGTDEVWHKEEKTDKDFLKILFAKVESNNRIPVVWRPGQVLNSDETTITQLWSRNSEPRDGHRFIDSRANYVNHMDPFSGMSRLFFQQPTRQPKGDEFAMGGILCIWPDTRIDEEINVLRQNPVYPAFVFYSEAVWNGKKEDDKGMFWANLPERGTKEFAEFLKFENKVVYHRNRWFRDKPFPYVAQTGIDWKLIGPFDHRGDFKKSFPVEDEIKDEYLINNKKYEWHDRFYTGATIHLNHFFGFPSVTKEREGTFYAFSRIYSPEDQEVGFWIGFQNYSRSGGRAGGPSALEGEWHNTSPKIWINDIPVDPPDWKQPGIEANSLEIPLLDEDYYYREPSCIKLKKGWNKVLIKIPHGKPSRKWMFTCIPVDYDGVSVKEVEGLEFFKVFK